VTATIKVQRRSTHSGKFQEQVNGESRRENLRMG
jgi:hypothetical protein